MGSPQGSIATIDDAVTQLKSRIVTVEATLRSLKQQLADAEKRATPKRAASEATGQDGKTWESAVDRLDPAYPRESNTTKSLRPEEYQRYGRQLIVPEVGIRGELSCTRQMALKDSSVLIVGLGGLGCPAAAYLAGAGVGKIGLVDGDVVERSNLHRQILHTEKSIGLEKVDSVAEHLRALNSELDIEVHHDYLTPSNAVETFQQYNIILDCTDRPATRYLVSDAAILANKPVVTASALRIEGQLMVLNDPRSEDTKRFCYRCIFPKPPPAESVLTCGEGGILGPVVGVMGVLMAMETMKIILDVKPSITNNDISNNTDKPATSPKAPPTLLLYSAHTNTPFRSIRLRGPKKSCISCSPTRTITPTTLSSSNASSDYETFCGTAPPVTILPPSSRLSPTVYSQLRLEEEEGRKGGRGKGEGGQGKEEGEDTPHHILIDVRDPVQFDLCHLPRSINLPFSALSRDPEASIAALDKRIASDKEIPGGCKIVFICRFGNDSQRAVEAFLGRGEGGMMGERGRGMVGGKCEVLGDVEGGFRAWMREVDGGFPEY